MTLNLIADQVINGKIYPSLAQNDDFDRHYPYTIPLRLQEYCTEHNVSLNIYNIENQFPTKTFYPIGIGFFDFSIDYIDLLPSRVYQRLQVGDCKLLFYYHEGDNPVKIKQRLDVLCSEHRLPQNCYVFVSGNTAAKSLPNFVYFTDFELWYYQRNRTSPALKIHSELRERDYTVLNRLHKPWRAVVMSDMKRNFILDNSYWSYCESGSINSNECPIEIDMLSGLRHSTEQFLNHSPYICDELNHDQRNDHSYVIAKYHENSYCNIVIETHFDIENSGAFLSEKTFKPIKHGQLFHVVGPAGSLQVLRDLGYSVFDSIFDNSYDLESNATKRWKALLRLLYFTKSNMHNIFKLCKSEIEHNQQLFQANKSARLNTLIKEINEHY